MNDTNHFPRHIAIVMDGNGRWAKQYGLPRIAGHRAGAKSVRKAVDFCVKREIQALTLFALSVENWKCRPQAEVEFLLSLFLDSLKNNTAELNENNVKIRIVGDLSPFNEKLRNQINKSEMLTAKNTGLTLVIAINYSGRWDIIQATRRLAEQVKQHALDIADITDESFQKYLCLNDLPEPDLLIRTSGEQRISNFMLWQFAYTEMFFSAVHWPDFDENVFENACAFYRSRQRRFGYTGEQLQKV